MIDHVVLGVEDIAASRAFYEQALAPLGVRVMLDLPGYLGFGDGDKPWFFVATREPSQRVHVAFSAQSRALVDAFHAAAVAAGGKDNGAPGPRPMYHPNYYGAFVYDPDGNNIEAVCHQPSAASPAR
ncbi:VOC family protein [Rhizocola hellebori]|uniref:VOC family protein n=1 Tax=Rhizocola hellebori TaxID=1392758 RepID=UPI00194395BD|nr:VOC family protein [Rhizocola hellebori]